MIKTKSGFTIVELLIVIVVIAILAAITIVSYNGIQERARYATMQQDLSSVNKAIQMFYADKGYYPYSGTTGASVGSVAAIPGLVSDYIISPPSLPTGVTGTYSYIWSQNGAQYKLVRLVPGGATISALEQTNPNLDTVRPGRGWGYWSSGGGGL